MSRTPFILLFIAVWIVVGCKKTETITPAIINAQLRIDTTLILQYIQQHGLQGKVKRVADTIGVYYQVLSPGVGNSIYTNSTQVTVGDTGRLLTTGAVFTQTNNFHPAYVLGQVIRGWQVGIPFVSEGGTIRLFVPSHYAYGPYAQQTLGLPANAVLDFNITLYAVTN